MEVFAITMLAIAAMVGGAVFSVEFANGRYVPAALWLVSGTAWGMVAGHLI